MTKPWWMSAVLAAALALIVTGCPAPKPPVNPPGGSGGSSSGGAGGAGPTASCTDAAAHAERVCPGAGALVGQTCPRVIQVDDGYIPCVMAATACFKCDSQLRAAAAHR